MSKVGSKMSSSSGPSSMTISTFSGGSSSIDSIPTPRSEGEILSSPNLKSFSFLELKNATRNFRPDSLLGEGGFGYVFKGWIDEVTHLASKPGSGMVIAVKKLKPEGFQGHKEWLVRIFSLPYSKCQFFMPKVSTYFSICHVLVIVRILCLYSCVEYCLIL